MHKSRYHVARYLSATKIGAIAVCAAGLITAAVALADQEQINSAEATVNGNTIELEIKVTGQGDNSEGAVVAAFAEIPVTVSCANKGKNKKEPNGVNQQVGVSDEEPLDNGDDANNSGNNVVFLEIVITDALDEVGDIGCPNGHNQVGQVELPEEIDILLIEDGEELDSVTCDLQDDETYIC